MKFFIVSLCLFFLGCVHSQIISDSLSTLGITKILRENDDADTTEPTIDAGEIQEEEYDPSTTSIEKERDTLTNALRGIEFPHLFRDAVTATKNLAQGVTVCSVCLIVGKSIIIQRKLGASREFLFDEITGICETLKIENKRVCRGVVDLNLDIILYIIDHRSFTAARFCGIVFQNFNCPYLNNDWTIDIPSGETVEKKLMKKNEKSFNILHLSDIHYDPRYTPGNSAECGEPVCCQDDQPPSDKPEDNCGYWSEYRDSDAPWHLVLAAFNQTLTHDFKYVYYTGDIIAHRVWETSVESNSKTIRQLFEQFKKSYDVPVYPCIGNHEPNPLNVFTPDNISEPQFSTHWLYDLSAELWSGWLPEDALATVRKCGYYTVEVEPGFRIIALNNNVCYSYNWWLLLDDHDPCGQLSWLVEVLTNAEKAGESVHIIAHIPSGDSTCFKIWSREYAKIVKRFANTITGQFVGHSHIDEFHLYSESSILSESVAHGVAFNGASVTTFAKFNPSYKIFTVDQETKGLLDYDEWTFNLTEANKTPDQPPKWYSLYKFTEAYGVENLDPVEIGNLVKRMTSDRDLNDKYFLFKSRNASVSTAEGCNDQCHKEDLCRIVTSVHGETFKCREARAKYNVAKVPLLNKIV